MSDEEKQDDKLGSRIGNLKQVMKLLTQPALRADERMDGLEEAQTNSERKIAAQLMPGFGLRKTLPSFFKRSSTPRKICRAFPSTGAD